MHRHQAGHCILQDEDPCLGRYENLQCFAQLDPEKSEPEMCRTLVFEFGLISVHATDLNFGLCKSNLCIWEEEVVSNAEVITSMLI